jgi:hypothetical protein
MVSVPPGTAPVSAHCALKTDVPTFHEEGFHFITAITKPQIDTLPTLGVLQMSLFEAGTSAKMRWSSTTSA